MSKFVAGDDYGFIETANSRKVFGGSGPVPGVHTVVCGKIPAT